MLYIYRFRLYPKKEQIEFLNRQVEHSRFVYNKLLEIAKKNYETEGKEWNCYEYKKLLPGLKEGFPFLKEANSQSLQEAVKWLDRAFKNFFKGDASWSRFIEHLQYKAKLYGRELIKVDGFFPSSKLCSSCGYKNEGLKLSDREWICPVCGTKHDRDINAALNLLKEGLTRLKRVVGVGCPELMPVEGTIVPCEAGSPSFS